MRAGRKLAGKLAGSCLASSSFANHRHVKPPPGIFFDSHRTEQNENDCEWFPLCPRRPRRLRRLSNPRSVPSRARPGHDLAMLTHRALPDSDNLKS